MCADLYKASVHLQYPSLSCILSQTRPALIYVHNIYFLYIINRSKSETEFLQRKTIGSVQDKANFTW